MRIQPKERYPWLVRLLLWIEKKRYGQALLPAKIWGRSPRALFGIATLHRALTRKKSPLNPRVRALVSLRVSELHHCSFCVDFNEFRSGRVEAQSPAEEVALAYAEAISEAQVSDELFRQLKDHYADDQIVELTGLITLQICSSKFNIALQIPSQEFCKKT